MIIWSRFGILYPVGWLIVGAIFAVLLNLIGVEWLIGHRFTMVIVVLLVCAANLMATVIEEDNESVSSLFFIPMPYWSAIGLVAAIAVAFGLIHL